MKIVRVIYMLLLIFSITLGGIPLQAKAAQPCPMAANMQMQHMDMEVCNGCGDMAKLQPEKGGCCDESGCNAKCPAMSGSMTMSLPSVKTDLPAIGDQASRFYPADAAVTSAHLNSQERPPKHLS